MGDMTKAKGAPTHPTLWTASGLVEERLGDIAGARKVFEAGIRLFPKHAALLKGLGELEATWSPGNCLPWVFENPSITIYHEKLGNLAGY